MFNLTLTVERDPFRREHAEGEPGAYRVIIHTADFPSKALEVETGSTEKFARMKAAVRLRDLADRLERGDT